MSYFGAVSLKEVALEVQAVLCVFRVVLQLRIDKLGVAYSTNRLCGVDVVLFSLHIGTASTRRWYICTYDVWTVLCGVPCCYLLWVGSGMTRHVIIIRLPGNSYLCPNFKADDDKYDDEVRKAKMTTTTKNCRPSRVQSFLEMPCSITLVVAPHEGSRLLLYVGVQGSKETYRIQC